MKNVTTTGFALHLDQKFLGTLDTYADAIDALNERGNWERVATVASGEESVDIFICRTAHGAFNYAYASITH
jgi:hypothetical protein